MKENTLLEKSKEFAVEIVNLCSKLKHTREYQIRDQLLRSGTSISANISEANYPQSRLDMISKFEIALKEASETENWLEILHGSNLILDEEYKKLKSDVVRIKILLIKSIKTLKNKIS